MTAHALKGDRDYALENGFSGYMTKPVRPQSIRLELEKWLAGEVVCTEEAEGEQDVESPALDRGAIDEIWAGDIETYAEIAEIFLGELEWRIPGLKDSCAGKLEHHAHSLKGAASNIGAVTLSGLAAELEKTAKLGKSDPADLLITKIEDEAKAVTVALKTEYLGG